jgi:hypothetical protein
MKGRLWIGALVAILLLLGGCAGVGQSKPYEPLSQKERGVFEMFYNHLTPAQRSHYLSLPTKAEREEYLYRLGILRKPGEKPPSY